MAKAPRMPKRPSPPRFKGAKRSTAAARRSATMMIGGVARRMAWLSGQGRHG